MFDITFTNRQLHILINRQISFKLLTLNIRYFFDNSPWINYDGLYNAALNSHIHT